jgi:hypothetical protein
MKSYELLRAAATLILEGGWISGIDAAAQAIDAADAEGNPVPLMVTGSTETGRAAPNPAAVKFSAYGAIVKALHDGGGRLEDPAAMWTLLAKRAAEINEVPGGGDNFVHPLRQLNANRAQTVDSVVAFLDATANEMEGVNRTIETVARAIPRLTEPLPYPGVALGPHPSNPPATLREVFDAVLDPNAKPLPPALTVEDVKDLHTTLAVPMPKPEVHIMTTAEIAEIHKPAVAYQPMLTTRTLREEHPPALYSGPELNTRRVGPNPFGGDDEQH